MTHSDRGHYANKHQGIEVDEKISSTLKKIAGDGRLTCAAGHKAAQDLGVSPRDIGVQADLMEFRITHCQMGLFGYKGGEKKIDPDFDIPADMGQAIDQALEKAEDKGRISCDQAWKLADGLGVKRIDFASACEKRGIRIKPCQLGAF